MTEAVYKRTFWRFVPPRSWGHLDLVVLPALLASCAGGDLPQPRSAAETSHLYAELQSHEERLELALAALRGRTPSVYVADPISGLRAAVRDLCQVADEIGETDAELRCQMARRRSGGARLRESTP